MAKQSLKQIAYLAIKEKILCCEYEPNAFLNEDLLCEEFHMSRTPIRDALSRMEQENLIRIVPKKGFFVAPFSIDDINMVFEGRLLIEPYILLNYCSELTEEQLHHLEQNLETQKQAIEDDRNRFYDIDNEFHDVIIGQCANRYLTDTLDTISAQNIRLRILSGRKNEARRLETIAEHEEILNALKERDAVKAAKAMQNHLMNSKKSSFEAYLSNTSAPKNLLWEDSDND